MTTQHRMCFTTACLTISHYADVVSRRMSVIKHETLMEVLGVRECGPKSAGSKEASLKNAGAWKHIDF